MKHDNPLDRAFQEKLANYSVEPPMHLWDGILAARAQKRRLGLGAYWKTFLLVLFCVFGVLAALFLQHPDQLPHQPVSDLSSFSISLIEETASATSSPAPAEALPSAAALPSPEAETSRQRAPKSGLQLPAAPASNKTPATIPVGLESKIQQAQEMPAVPEVVRTTEDRPTAITDTPAETQLDWVRQVQLLPAWWQQLEAPSFAPLNPKDCHSFEEKGWNFYAEALLGSEIPLRSITPREPEFSDYAKARLSSEKPGFSFSTGARVTAVTGSGIALRAGLQYTQFNETFSYQNQNEVRIVITNLFDNSGNIIGTDTIYQSGTRVKVSYNQLQMLDIPVMAGYELNFPRFSMALYGGAYFNLMFRPRGDILAPDLKPVSISSGDSEAYPAYTTNLGMSFAGSVGFYYRLSDRMQVVLEPQFRYFLNPFSADDYPLKQEYVATSITTGLRFQLFGKDEE